MSLVGFEGGALGVLEAKQIVVESDTLWGSMKRGIKVG